MDDKQFYNQLDEIITEMLPGVANIVMSDYSKLNDILIEITSRKHSISIENSIKNNLSPVIKHLEGEGQGKCSRCGQINWTVFLSEIEGIKGQYCSNCLKELVKKYTLQLHNTCNTQVILSTNDIVQALRVFGIYLRKIYRGHDINSFLNIPKTNWDILELRDTFKNEYIISLNLCKIDTLIHKGK